MAAVPVVPITTRTAQRSPPEWVRRSCRAAARVRARTRLNQVTARLSGSATYVSNALSCRLRVRSICSSTCSVLGRLQASSYADCGTSTEAPASRPRYPSHASRARESAQDIAKLSSREFLVCAIRLRDEHWSWASSRQRHLPCCDSSPHISCGKLRDSGTVRRQSLGAVEG